MADDFTIRLDDAEGDGPPDGLTLRQEAAACRPTRVHVPDPPAVVAACGARAVVELAGELPKLTARGVAAAMELVGAARVLELAGERPAPIPADPAPADETTGEATT